MQNFNVKYTECETQFKNENVKSFNKNREKKTGVECKEKWFYNRNFLYMDPQKKESQFNYIYNLEIQKRS